MKKLYNFNVGTRMIEIRFQQVQFILRENDDLYTSTKTTDLMKYLTDILNVYIII